MESPVQGRPNRETGLPPGVEVGPLGKRFVAFLINLSVPAIVSFALILPAAEHHRSAPPDTGRDRCGHHDRLARRGLVHTRRSRGEPGSAGDEVAASRLPRRSADRPCPGLSASLVFWALCITGIGLLIMLIMMLRHPRKQGWHDLAVTSVMIKERLLAPPVQPARAAAGAQQRPGSGRQIRSHNRATCCAAAPPSYAPGEGYAPAGVLCRRVRSPAWRRQARGSVRRSRTTGGSAAPYGGNAYAAPPQGAPYGAPPYGSSPTSQPSGGEHYSPVQPAGPMSPLPQVLLPAHRLRTRTSRSMQLRR